MNEELEGFAEEFSSSPDKLVFYSWTYLISGCSHASILPSLTDNNHPLVLRSYDLNERSDDMMLFYIQPVDKYSYYRFSVLLFGASEGINEYGLCVTQSSCGIPVGNLKGMKKPVINGLQFWVVIRAILEQCRTVDQSLRLIKSMPIAYNINLIIADASGESALVEIYNGKFACKKIDSKSKDQFICATNHIVMDELIDDEKLKLLHSKIRLDLMNETLSKTNKIDKKSVKSLLSKKYPDGLTCHNYKKYFGTLRSMIFDLKEKSIEVCFGSPQVSDWHRFDFNKNTQSEIFNARIIYEKYSKDFIRMV